MKNEAVVTLKPSANQDFVAGFQAFQVPIIGEHQITITAAGDDDDVNGHLVWLVAIGVAAAVGACTTNNNTVVITNSPNSSVGGTNQGVDSGSGYGGSGYGGSGYGGSGSGGPRPQ